MFLGEKMKRLFLFFLLLNVVLAFAQDELRICSSGSRLVTDGGACVSLSRIEYITRSISPSQAKPLESEM